MALFPEISAFENAPMVYQEDFLKKFNTLKRGEKNQVKKAVERLAELGHSAIRTKKVRVPVDGSVLGDYSSRASRSIRLLWRRTGKDGGSSIILLQIVRRGNIGFSEA